MWYSGRESDMELKLQSVLCSSTVGELSQAGDRRWDSSWAVQVPGVPQDGATALALVGTRLPLTAL